MFLAYLLTIAQMLVPSQSQESVDTAVRVFRIQVPENVTGIVYNPFFPEDLYGLAQIGNGNCFVQIGPSSFSSWSMLGTVLAHEVEAQCNESQADIALAALFDSKRAAIERRAYQHQLKEENIKRFGNTPEEVQFFEYLWRTRYPE